MAIFTDAGFEINGVTLGLNRLIQSMNRRGGNVSLVVSGERDASIPVPFEEYLPHITTLPALKTFTLPVYGEYLLGIPSVSDVVAYLTGERIDIVQISTPGPVGMVTLVAAKLCGLKVVMNYHTEIAKFAFRLTGDARFSDLIGSLVGFFYRQADAVIAPSRAVRDGLIEMGVGRKKIAVIPRGVDSRRFSPIKGAGRKPADVPTVLYVGRVSREKGLDTLFRAFESVREKGIAARLVVVGDGPARRAYEDRYADSDVTFVGYRTGDALAQSYASADLFAFPSATDTFGNAVLEAHASGLPVIAVASGGPKEQVVNGKNGILVPPDDVASFSAAMEMLLGHSRLRASMAAAARRRGLALTHEASADAHLAFYRSLCHAPSSGGLPFGDTGGTAWSLDRAAGS